MAKRIAVYIGRFQPFNRGHAHVLGHCLENYDHTVVLIGSAFKARDIENPFTFEERRDIIDSWLSEQWTTIPSVKIRPLRDYRYNNALWTQAVQQEVAREVERLLDLSNEPYEITLVGSDRDSSTSYLNTFPQWGQDLRPPFIGIPDLSASRIRRRYFESSLRRSICQGDMHPGLVEASVEFLKTFVKDPAFATLQSQHEFLMAESRRQGEQTVRADACIVHSGHVLVVRRSSSYGQDLLTLPGSIVPSTQRIRECAIKSVMAQTGIQLATGRRAEEITESMLDGSIVGFEQFDHPTRSLESRDFANTFLIRLKDTKSLPKLTDRGHNVHCIEWMPIAVAQSLPEQWFEDGHERLEIMVSRIKD